MRLRQILLAAGILAICSPVQGRDGPSYVEHCLQRGETLSLLARVYGVPLESLLASNADLVPESMPVGIRVVVPAPAEGWATYQVQPGDTLSSVAQRYQILGAELRALNPGSPELSPGSLLVLPRAPGALAPTTPALPGGPTDPSPRSEPPKLPKLEPSDTPWVQVLMGDGSQAWAPRSALLVASRTPLDRAGVVSIAGKLMGTPYQGGGESPNGADCSGFVQEVFQLAGYRLPRTADAQFQDCAPLELGQAQPADLVFFSTTEPGPSHVGIYLGGGAFLHASSSKGVTQARLDEPYFAARFLGVRRLKAWCPDPGDVPKESDTLHP